MQTITVKLTPAANERSYPIHIGAGILDQAELILPHLPQKRVAIVTNTTVAPLYLARLQGVGGAGVASFPIILPDGEEHKNWHTLNLIHDGLLSSRCERNTTVIALGGGWLVIWRDSPQPLI